MKLILLIIIPIILCYNNTLLQPNVIKLTGDGDRDCKLYFDQVPDAKTCLSLNLSEPQKTCCYVYYEVGEYNNSFCMPIVKNSSSHIEDIKYAFRHSKNLEIDCSVYYMKYNSLFYILSFILLLIVN